MNCFGEVDEHVQALHGQYNWIPFLLPVLISVSLNQDY